MAAPTGAVEGNDPRFFVQPDPVLDPDDEGAGDYPAEDVELLGVTRVKIGAILGVIALGLALGSPVALLFVFGVGLTFLTNVTSIGSIGYAALTALVLALFLGVALAVASFIAYLAGFAKLRRIDTRFSVPLGVAAVGAAGLLALALVFGLLAALVVQVYSCGGPGVATSQCVTLSTVSPPEAVFLAGLILSLVGWIGLIVGLYRLGKRYGSTITRVGALLYVVPVANVIAPVLVAVGAHGIQKYLRATPMATAPSSTGESEPPGLGAL